MLKTVFVDEAARLLGVSRRTIYYRIQEGKLLTVRTACGSQRVLVDSIESLLQGRLGAARLAGPSAVRTDRSPCRAFPADADHQS